MQLGPGALRAGAGVGTLVVTGACAGVVALDTHPADAPLRPPLNPTAVISGDTGAAAQPQQAALQIPPSQSCAGGATAPAMTPELQDALRRLAAATTKQARRALLTQLSPALRTQVLAAAGSRSRCHAAQTAPAAPVQPGVVDVAPSGPAITDTYVS